jgi:Flp pilus assembly protein TadD
MGLLYRRENNLPEALQEFETAARLDPNDGKAHGNLGFVLLEMRQFDAAQSHFLQALKINPNDAVARTGLEEARRARP